ncbi:MAG: sigma-70 family RNA polymerase sigma factor [Anaerolineae bacterium]|nr:sigma-70 family RNA polymerase sigma factor [Anaerolineae bacterium]
MGMDENALIARAQEGDVDAFNRLVLAYQQLAYNVAYRVVGNPDSAADATQDAFLRAFRALSSFRGGSFKAWLLRIVTNCCYDQMRGRKRRPTTALDDILEDDEHNELLADASESPEDYVSRLDLDATIERALQSLPYDQRVIVIMSDIQGLSYEEISQTVSVSLGTVKSRLSRGRTKMRDYLLAHQELLPPRFRLGGE